MKFPRYIPESVRRQVIWYLEGDKTRRRLGWMGWNSVPNTVEYAEIRRDADCIRRLVTDLRMRLVYESLEFTEEQWDLFFQAAWAANNNYSVIRVASRRELEQVKEIGQKALELSQLLSEFISIRGDLPGELFNTHSLLKESGKRVDWMSGIVLGESRQDLEIIKRIIAEQGDNLENDPDEERRYKEEQDVIHYVWSKAPPPATLLKIMSDAALKYEPWNGRPFIEQAISSRKKNPKKAYIRAFKALLTEYGINHNTPAIKKAIVITSAVVLDDQDINDISYDDVRKP
jgi:hypothetical protein